jgi:hypothetical protein
MAHPLKHIVDRHKLQLREIDHAHISLRLSIPRNCILPFFDDNLRKRAHPKAPVSCQFSVVSSKSSVISLAQLRTDN